MPLDSANRIVLNTLATFTRSAVALFVGVFTSRWVLNALGASDFGLYAVTGSVVLLSTFINTALSIAVSRFYAYELGAVTHQAGNETRALSEWFNTALSLHLALALAILFIAAPVGEYAVRHWLTVPEGRRNACIWVYRVSMASAIVTVVSVPYIAMFTAHQLIAELSLFQILSSAISLAGAWMLRRFAGDRLLFYAGYMFLAGAGILLVQMFRARLYFGTKCKASWALFFSRAKIQVLMTYLSWKLLGTGFVTGRNQGMPILINVYFGPVLNAAMGIANTLTTHAQALSAGMVGAMQPALTSIYASGDRDLMLRRVMQSCKLASLLLIVFALPLWIVMPELLDLWLKEPPPFTAEFCRLALLGLLAEKITNGHMIAVNAHGRIREYEIIQGSMYLAAIPLAWLGFRLFGRELAAAEALLATTLGYCLGRVFFARWLVKIPVRPWLLSVVLPLTLTIFFAGLAGFLLKHHLRLPPWTSLLTVTASTGLLLAGLGWFFTLDASERKYFRTALDNVGSRLAQLKLAWLPNNRARPATERTIL